MSEESKVVHYVSPKAPHFRLRVKVDGKDVRVRFDNGRLRVTDPKLVAALDEAIASKVAIRQLVRKVDKAQAEGLVKRHRAAHKGGMTSLAASGMRQGLAGSSKTLGETAPNNPEALAQFADELAHGELAITEKVPAAITPAHVDGNPKTPVAAKLFSSGKPK